MSSEEVSLIAEHPFIRRFVWAILQNVRAQSLVRGERYVVHADLVPRVSERVMMKSMEMPKVVLPKVVEKPVVVPRVVPVRNFVPTRVAPPRVVPPRAPVQGVVQSQIAFPPINSDVGLSQDYGKIMPLLGDVSVSMIECPGAGKPLMVIRAGRRQLTRISFSTEEITEFLDKVSDVVHIPILEGVFRAAVDNFAINAVVSDIIGSRFVIKKANAFAMFGQNSHTSYGGVH